MIFPCRSPHAASVYPQERVRVCLSDRVEAPRRARWPRVVALTICVAFWSKRASKASAWARVIRPLATAWFSAFAYVVRAVWMMSLAVFPRACAIWARLLPPRSSVTTWAVVRPVVVAVAWISAVVPPRRPRSPFPCAVTPGLPRCGCTMAAFCAGIYAAATSPVESAIASAPAANPFAIKRFMVSPPCSQFRCRHGQPQYSERS